LVKLPHSTQNWTTLIGATIASISLALIVFLFLISFFVRGGGAYLGLITYILLPAVMVMGLLLIPIGMWFKVRHDRRGAVREGLDWPMVDLNNVRHRNAFFIFSTGTVALVFMSAFGSYEAYHFTESVRFCGTVCHSVMHPEYTAYQGSPHARVACVGCHVGPGADWYVRSKISGLYQVYAVTVNNYPRPIPTPIENLRPARETCEECHWPQKFYSQSVRYETHYLPDKDNTEWDIELIMKIGAQRSALGLSEGIHWHINRDVRIEYIADEARQKIFWVRYTNAQTGAVRIFQDKASPLSEDQVRNADIRTMDCMDCHNRPSHDYRAPTIFLNDAMTSGAIPRELPDIKSVAVELCAKEYPSDEAAFQAIDSGVQEHYRTKYPDLYAAKKPLIDHAAAGVEQAFAKNIFPVMKVRWNAYPNDIGHLEFNGCFRCHNGTHSSQDGQVISRDCNLCHFIVAQGTPGKMEAASVEQQLEFRHPEDIGDMWKEMLCTECHTGVSP
jgi:formate-dependent nitrite reductase cytochrome c552 subunit